MDEKKPRRRVQIRTWTPDDIPALVACHKAAYPDYPEEGGHYGRRVFEFEYNAFPEGQFLAEIDGRVVGYATSLIVQLDDDAPIYRFSELTGGGTFSTHTPSGDTLYGADIAVHPDYRSGGIAKRLYQARKKLLKRYNLRRMVAYGRLPGYSGYAGQMNAEEYVQKVTAGELQDPALNAHLSAGYEVKKVVFDLFWDDASLNYQTLLEMPNPDYKPARRRIAAAPLHRPVRKVRVCAAQYLMRPVKSWEDLVHNVEFFVHTADQYHCHYLLLPEYFTVQLFTMMPQDWNSEQLMRQVARHYDRYLELFTRMARQYNLHIIGGSTAVERDDGHLYNVAHLFTPTGQVYSQDKLHITPSERTLWDIRAGHELRVFDTSLARIAVLICYDIEFPELARLLAMAGVEIIFVPLSTDERKAYHRVKVTAQARSVENYMYTVLSGIAGNLPHRDYLLNYARSAVFTPSDFAFPLNATAGEADPNVETVVIAELDLTSLAQQRDLGAVRPLHDRRPDLYDLRLKQRVQIIRTE